jgi:SpoVK/Ycf46/Vps4 family AAA+-type ATPase
MVRAVVSEISRKSGKAARFFVVRPSEWESSLVGATERNIRDTFATLREAAQDGSLVVLFLDEIEGIGRTRGYAHNMFADKALAALLSELDGFTGREGIAVIATTNRKDLIDPALLSRLSDQEIHVRPPDRRGAEEIFAIHLKPPPCLPYNPNGTLATATRRRLIDTAVARIYDPNSPYAELCRLKFRDGKTTRLVAARDFASGRLFEQICRAARQAAFQRELETGQGGITVADMEDAIATAMERMATTLSVHNVHHHLLDLPDLDVAAVERLPRKLAHPHHYLTPGT